MRKEETVKYVYESNVKHNIDALYKLVFLLHYSLHYIFQKIHEISFSFESALSFETNLNYFKKDNLFHSTFKYFWDE